jgi:ferrous iron transport protein A
MPSATTVSVGSMEKGDCVNVLRIAGGREMKARLYSMGIMPGNTVEVLSNCGRGPIIVKIMGSQVALGRGMAGRVWVRKTQASRT